MNAFADYALLRYRGTILALIILDHTCWLCRIPFFCCRYLRRLSMELAQVDNRTIETAERLGETPR